MTDEYIINDENMATPKEEICVPRHNAASGTTTGFEVFFAIRNKEDFLENGQIDPNGVRVSRQQQIIK